MAKERKASVIYEGNASQLVYAFPFDYLRKKFVKVEDIYTNITELTIGVDYTVEDKQVRLVKGIPLGHSVNIYRETTTAPLVEWQDASVLRSADLSLQEVQLLHLAEETADKVFDSGMSTAYDNPNCWDGQYKRIINALDPIEDGDVVTLRYIKANQDSLLNQLKNTGATQNSSIVATGDTQNARLNATGDTQNKRVTDTGNIYVSTMTTLKDTATIKANDAGNSAELSKKWAMSSSSPDGVTGNKSSKTWAEEAKTSAGNSAASASASKSSANASASSATNSANSANSSKQSASASANSASAAASSASAASTSATNAKTSETTAAKSATAAAASAEAAKLFDPSSYAKYNEIFPITGKGRYSIQAKGITDLNSRECLSYPSWECLSGSYVQSLANCPTERNFYLFNLRNGSSSSSETLPNLTSLWYYMIQILVDDGANVWTRNCYNDATTTFTFGTWKKIASLADLPTKTSQLTNDSNFVNTASLEAEAKKWKAAYNNLRKRSTPTAFDDDELTVLIDTRTDPAKGVTLPQPYTNFDGLLIEYTGDNQTIVYRTYISTEEINKMIESILSHPNKQPEAFFMLQGTYYWSVKAVSSYNFSTTFFPNNDNNVWIYKIYGVKFKKIT